MAHFDLLSSDQFHVVLHPNKKHGLIFNRMDGNVATINYDDAKELSNLRRNGRSYGIVGKYMEKYLVLIKNRSLVGSLLDPRTKEEHKVYAITQVQVVDISSDLISRDLECGNSVRYDASSSQQDFQDQPVNPEKPSFTNDQDFMSLPITISTNSFNKSRSGPWNPFKLANSLRPKMATQFLKSNPVVDSLFRDTNNISSGHSAGGQNHTDDSDKRLVDEMMKLFNGTNSFYFSPTLDLTNRFSRKNEADHHGVSDKSCWRQANRHFFWNRYMLRDLLELGERDSDVDHFIYVILQGFISIEQYQTKPKDLHLESAIEAGILATSVNIPEDQAETNLCEKQCNAYDSTPDCDSYSLSSRSVPSQDRSSNREKLNLTKSRRLYQFALISRRSVFYAGTRYRRRGCDEEGNCANFVETEQIFRYDKHFLSIVMLRGSIPLYWYQSGFNYRPPPMLHRDESENQAAFCKHYEGLIETYQTENIISVDCTEQSGREKNLHDAFESHMNKLKVKHPSLKLIQFDFHRLCRARQSSDLHIERSLKSCGLSEQIIKDVKYYWNDGDVVWYQDGVFRVNCIDCSDRTNLVQRAIALRVLDLQLSRLGVIAPDTCPDDNEFRRLLQGMWSANGNVLSTQYCGTRALFTGDKKISGYLKDTYSSASRYYMGKFRDAYRQAAINAMLGIDNNVSPTHKNDINLSEADQYELISLDPGLVGRGGSALLRDVSSKVTDRLSRLKGKFNMKPSDLVNMQYSRDDTSVAAMALESNVDLTDAGRLSPPLSGLDIDWPSSESMEHGTGTSRQPDEASIAQGTDIRNNLFDQLSHSDDSFQDDEFGQLTLSSDLSELQRVRKESDSNLGHNEKPEEIDLTEASGGQLKNKNRSNDSQRAQGTSTTTT